MGGTRKARPATPQTLGAVVSFTRALPQYVRGTLRPMLPDLGRHALKAALSFVAAAIVVALIRDPVEQHVIPWLIKRLSYEQALYIYTDPSNEADDQYDFLVPRYGLASGRMIQDPAVTARDHDRQEPRNFKVRGVRSGNLLTFTYESSSDKVGIGAFVGQRLDDGNDDVYVGNLTGLGHDGSGKCTLVSYWAVVGPAEDKQHFGEILRKAVGESAPVKLSSSDASVKCNESKTSSAASQQPSVR
jgi:hypothetical protein